MVVFCSNLPNDRDMIRALGSLAVPCADFFTDCAFWGKGENDAPLQIGIERKKIGDLAACINDGRLLYQAQIAHENGIDVFCLVVEGSVRSNPDDGLLETPCWDISPRTGKRCEMWKSIRPAIQYSRFASYLCSLQYLAGSLVFRTGDIKETAAVIRCLHEWFQRSVDEHQSLKKMFKRPPPTVQLVRPGLLRRIAAELPGVGWEKSKAVAEHFESVTDLAGATEQVWLTIPGIGKTLAKRIAAELRGEDGI